MPFANLEAAVDHASAHYGPRQSAAPAQQDAAFSAHEHEFRTVALSVTVREKERKRRRSRGA